MDIYNIIFSIVFYNLILVIFKKEKKKEILFVKLHPSISFFHLTFNIFSCSTSWKKKKEKRMRSKLISRETQSVFSTSQGVNSNSKKKN